MMSQHRDSGFLILRSLNRSSSGEVVQIRSRDDIVVLFADERLDSFGERFVVQREHPRGENARIFRPRFADRHGCDGNSTRHLHDRK